LSLRSGLWLTRFFTNDISEQAFSVFAIFFEVVSAYGNVGLSLGHPDNLTSLSGHFTIFGKVVICAMMIRGRHRGMPYALDRAINLPSDRLATKEKDENEEEKTGWRRRGSKVAASVAGFPRSFTR
jgi:Trk-type K+ transport system membrane component